MSVIGIAGSPRKGGNSETILDAVLAGARANGKEVRKYDLNGMDIRGCQACLGCKKDGVCVQKDDLIALLEDVKRAEAVVLATPVYFGQPSGQMRLFQDRCYSYIDMGFRPFVEPGKGLVTVVTAGSGSGAESTASAMEGPFAGLFGMVPRDRIVFTGGGPPDAAAKDADLLARAEAAGRRL